MRAVNLLPRDEGRAQRQPGAVLLTAVLGSVLLTAVLCGWFMMASSGVSDKQAQLDGAKAELMAIPPPEAPDTSQSTLVAEKDVLVVMSNCPQFYNPCSGWNPTPIRVIAWRPG